MIEKLVFGRSGHESTRTLFGAASLSNVTQAEADQTLDLLLQYGVNHIDTAASYGESELRIGPWMDRYRSQFFLATKTGERTYQKAKDQFHKSLERLRVSSVDLIQLHYLVDPTEWEIALGPGGALEALVEARDQGLVKYIGVTGHDVSVPVMHKRALERFDFDAVLLPYNFTMMQNPQYAADFEALIAVCQQRNVAVQTIKSIAHGPWANQHDHHAYATWYEPITDQQAIDKAVHWVLGRPGVFLNTVGDIHVLPKVLDAASRFERRPSDAEMQAEIDRIGAKPLFV
ncbi:MAG TPA: aldo/keto reductase, partial [Phototrophicaceae bacterium]|nr:aldo/keto reductase [Phototrophicaceae bacterium]